MALRPQSVSYDWASVRRLGYALHVCLCRFVMILICLGKENATVEVAMFSLEYPAPAGLANQDMWIQEGFTKKDNVVK